MTPERWNWMLVPAGLLCVAMAWGRPMYWMYEEVDPNAKIIDWSEVAILFGGGADTRAVSDALVLPLPAPLDAEERRAIERDRREFEREQTEFHP